MQKVRQNSHRAPTHFKWPYDTLAYICIYKQISTHSHKQAQQDSQQVPHAGQAASAPSTTNRPCKHSLSRNNSGSFDNSGLLGKLWGAWLGDKKALAVREGRQPPKRSQSLWDISRRCVFVRTHVLKCLATRVCVCLCAPDCAPLYLKSGRCQLNCGECT